MSADTSLGTKTLKSAFWAYGSYVGGRLLVLVSTAILARLLAARGFGLVALARSCSRLLETFRDLGLSQALIVSKEDELEQAKTVFRAGHRARRGARHHRAVGPLVARFFDEPELVPLLLRAVAVLPAAGAGRRRTTRCPEGHRTSAPARPRSCRT